MKYLTTCVLLAAFAVTVAACGDSGVAGTSSPAETTSAAPGAGAVNATALCDFLRSEIPRLQPVGSEAGRLAQLTVSLYNWTEEQKIQAKFDMDQITQKTCPDVRADRICR